jgi:hypothetical protein
VIRGQQSQNYASDMFDMRAPRCFTVGMQSSIAGAPEILGAIASSMMASPRTATRAAGDEDILQLFPRIDCVQQKSAATHLTASNECLRKHQPFAECGVQFFRRH